jgi:iron complex outermembrane receptor protein
MFTKNLILAASLSAILFSNSANAVIGPIKITLNPTEVSSNYFNEVDTLAPFSSEVYTEDDIKASKSNDVYDFLSQNTSLALAPSSGNRFSQSISTRGFGLTEGYQNIVITLNGRRLNNIDMTNSNLGGIDINNIAKIEITKGSGSVIYGDNASAGVIHIFTKKDQGFNTSTSLGNYGHQDRTISYGISNQNANFNVSNSRLEHGGYGAGDALGNKDKGEQTNSNVGLGYKLNNGIDFQLELSRYDVDNRYPNYITRAQFDLDPSRDNLTKVRTNRKANSDTKSFSIKAPITDSLSVTFDTSKISKTSQTRRDDYYNTGNYGTFSRNDYDYRNNDLVIGYKSGNLTLDSGIKSFKANRKGSIDTLTKDNMGIFSRLQLTRNDTIYSIGARREVVDHKYEPTSGVSIIKEDKFNAFDIGFNTRLNDATTIFSNFNQAFQSPDVDRYFKFGTWPALIYNPDLKAPKSKTINIGLNYLTDDSKTKTTLFRTNLTNEIYLCKQIVASDCGSLGDNLNLDKSHKYGLELQNKYNVNSKLSTNINYAYTVAKIDSEDRGSGAFNGKTLPMTSKHNISASAIYYLNDKVNITLTQKFRSKGFAADDFSNTFTQKQMAYNSTDFNFSYTTDKELELKFDVENLFDRSYGTIIQDDAIYPASYTRNIKLSFSRKF